MKFRAGQHELGTGLADGGAGSQKADVFCFGVLPTQSKAVVGSLDADAIAVQTVLDAFSHCTSDLCGVGHFQFLLYSVVWFLRLHRTCAGVAANTSKNTSLRVRKAPQARDAVDAPSAFRSGTAGP